jgi:predicted Zn-dependent peptidase
VTSIAHQLGYFETIASVDIFTSLPARIAAVTLEQVAEAARAMLTESNRTVAWFDPLPIGAAASEGSASALRG